MAFDYKKEYKEFYLPKSKPGLVTVPAMNFVAVRGKGDPNEEGGDYKTAMGLLYGLAFTIKMSKLGEHQIEGYFDYVVPPLEGLWWQEGRESIDYSRKDLGGTQGQWHSIIKRACCDRGRLWMGAPGSSAEKAARFFAGRIFVLGGRALRSVHACRSL